MIVCPNCEGRKQLPAFVECADRRQSGFRTLACNVCKGTGEITEEHAKRLTAGERMRRDRVARRVGLREEAERLGMTARELGDLEHGRVSRG